MIKRIGIGAFIFIIGLGVAILFESDLRQFIQALYLILSGHSIYFIGKDFNLFAGPFYYSGFGIMALSLWVGTTKTGAKKNLIFWLLTIMTFFIVLITTIYVDTIFKLTVCTACTDGRRSLRYNDINYDFIIVISIVIALVPSVVRIWVKLRMPSPKKV